MSASLPASLSSMLMPAGAPRIQAADDRPRDGGIWQQAFQAAARTDGPPPDGVDEAARMLALGNLALSPVQATTLPPGVPGVEIHHGQAPPAQSTPPIHEASTAASHGLDAMALDRTAARPASPALLGASAADVAPAAAAAPHGAMARGADDGQAGHAASGRSSASQHADPVASPVAARPRAVIANMVVASYAAAMTAAPASSDRAVDFSLMSRSSTLPVRVHVQWRDRVADVWIGLHRQAFDQLPDIHAGVEDWVVSRGGVLGHVVCNGEALARVAPSVSFLGAL